jgi:hypothetical protein
MLFGIGHSEYYRLLIYGDGGDGIARAVEQVTALIDVFALLQLYSIGPPLPRTTCDKSAAKSESLAVPERTSGRGLQRSKMLGTLI